MRIDPNDYVGKTFGYLTVISYLGEIRKKDAEYTRKTYSCQCKCDGKIINVIRSSLTSGNTKSCGCYRKEITHKNLFQDLTGKKFGRLTVLNYVRDDKNGIAMWECVCDCGNLEHVVCRGMSLKKGSTKSCGCLNIETIKNVGYKNLKDLTGQTFGYFKVLKRVDSAKYLSKYLCRCIYKNCNTEIEVYACNLKNGHSTSCGCLQKDQMKKFNITGKTFGLLTALEKLDNFKNDKTFYSCKCICGNVVEVESWHLKSGWTKSCGCFLNRHEETSIEKKIREQLEILNIKFIQEFPIKNHRRVFTVVDFYLPDFNLCVYPDGGHWHTMIDVKTGKSRRLRDYKINHRLKQLGFKVVRLWEKKINNDLEGCKNKILEAISIDNLELEAQGILVK